MPELPEVETVRNYLKENILNKKIINIDILYPKMIENDINDFKKKLINNSFIDIQRKGKYLIFVLDKYYLISHLRMEGKFNIKPISQMNLKHEHVIFYFEDFTLRYNDTRKFGRMKLINKDEINGYFENIGPDANKVQYTEQLLNKINKSNKCIKTILLDQSIMSGIGNIYADEILFKSKISPFLKGKEITKNNLESIIYYSKDILNDSIKHNGTTIKSYTFSLNHSGNYQNYLLVHKNDGKPCKICNEIILKSKIDGRSTYYCKKCQNVGKIAILNEK